MGTENNFHSWMNKYLYYALIFLLSLITLFALPMLGSEVGLGFNLPSTAAGWVVWIISNIAASILNVLMFHAFIKQGKLNILLHPNYLAANELLRINNIGKVELPLSPKQWHSRQYRNKGITLFVFTLLGTVAFGQAILTFNLVKFISQVIVLLCGLVFGFMEMKATEDYWTIEYYEYAKLEVEKKQQLEKERATTDYYEITEKTITERTQQIPIQKEESTNNVHI